MSSAMPNTSLYVKNINSKVKKPELRRQLYSLFGSYGKVLDVVATRADGMRGQAFVVFRDLQSATAALRALDGFEFYEKPLKLEYARTRSKATVVAEHGEEALLRPDLIYKNADGTAIGGRVTFSNAQGDAQAQERKRLRDESGSSIAPTNSAVEPLRSNSNATDVRPSKAARTEPIPDSESHHAQMHNQNGVEKADDDDDDDDGMCFRTWTHAKQLWKLETQTRTIEHYGPWLNSYHGCCCKHNRLCRSFLESPPMIPTYSSLLWNEIVFTKPAISLDTFVCP